MKEIKKEEFVSAVKNLLIQSHYFLPEDVLQSLKDAIKQEKDHLAKDVLLKILSNAELSSITGLSLCQDTGFPQFFINIGKGAYFDFIIEEEVINIVKIVYEEEKLRKSCVNDPLKREINTHCCTTYIEHNYIEDEKCEISVLIRGGGSENTTNSTLFLPTTDISQLYNNIKDTILKMLPYTCPPVVIGIGIGGSVEQSMILAKKSLLREIGNRNPDKFYSELEIKIKEAINQSKIGPLGLGGSFSVFDVFIEKAPTHIATLPVSVTLQCHSYRKGKVVI